MKKWLFFAFAFCLSSLLLKAQDASVSFATFKGSPQNYIEIYLHLVGSTVEFVPLNDSTIQATVEVMIVFQQADTIVKFDKFVLNSPVAEKAIDFIDLKRYSLDNGEYKLMIGVQDVNNPESKKEYNTKVIMDYGDQKLNQSDLQLLASYEKSDQQQPFVKNGYFLEPLPYNFYNRNNTALSFYNEIYGADQYIGEDFLVSYSIEKLLNDKSNTVMIGHKRQKARAVVPLLIQMDISKLESGNYQLNVEVRDRAKKLLSEKSTFFQRSNPYLEIEKLDSSSIDLHQEFVEKLSADQLKYSLQAITVHLPQNDIPLVDRIIKDQNIKAQKLYLFSFWAKESPTNPEFAFKKYMEVVEAVDKLFKSGFRNGFETDRGYVYLKYGQPDDMERREEEPSAPPYEIWTYYDFPSTTQNNVKFIFYNPSLAAGDFVLLHSTAIGELNNPRWQIELYRDATLEQGNTTFDDLEVQDNFNRNASRIFRDY